MKRPSKRTAQKPRRGKVRKVIETPSLLAILDVPALFYPDDPREPYLEPATVKLLTQARRFAHAGNSQWLKKHGARVYVQSPAA
jgi:hypothetical protein